MSNESLIQFLREEQGREYIGSRPRWQDPDASRLWIVCADIKEFFFDDPYWT